VPRKVGRTRDRVLGASSVVVYGFLYLPILVIVGLSFNRVGQPTRWGGFSTQWYGELLRDTQLIDAFKNTLVVALVVTAISTVLGTLLAIGLERTVRSKVLDSALFLPAVVPDIVLAIGLLSFFTLVGATLGLRTIIAAHVVFDMIFVSAIVRTRLGHFDRSIEEAAQDLGATRLATYLRVTFPVILPGIVAGALVAFTISFDEFIIAYFTSGIAATFPIRVYSRIRFGQTPVINAVATVLLVVSFTMILIAARLNGRAARRALERAV